MLIGPPLPFYCKQDGSALSGSLYFGSVNQNPETSPVTIYWDSGLTQPAVQPIKTAGGVPVRNGTPAQLYVGSAYSLTARDSAGAVVFYFADSSAFDASWVASSLGINLANAADTAKGDALVAFKQPLANSTSSTVHEKLSRYVDVKDFGAQVDGTTNDAAAVQLAANNGPVYVPPGTIKTDSPPTGDYRLFSFGSVFSGATPLDSAYPAFGPGAGRFISVGGYNSLIGIAYNNKAANTAVFPTGVTGYGRVDSAGNQVFGLFGRADLYAATGVATNEYNSFNYGAAPSSALPPDRSFGTAQSHPIAVTVAAGGNYNSSIGIHVCREGSAPQQFLTGAYFSPDSCVNYGIFIDSTSSSTFTPLVLKHAVSKIGMQVQGSGTPVAGNAWLTYTDGTGAVQFAAKQDGRLSFPSAITQTAHGVAGAAATLPSNPTGYLKVEIGGGTKIIPYYEP